MPWGLEIESDRLRLCRAELRGGRLALRRRAEVPVPAGLIRPALKEPNVGDAAALAGLLRGLCAPVGCRGWVRVALPDPVFTLRNLTTDALPTNRAEARRFLRWQAKELLPFPAEEARLDFLPGAPGADGRPRAICLLARDRVLTEYEQCLGQAGLQAAVLDARSISLAQAASAGLGPGPAALLVVTAAWTTLLLVQAGQPRFWRLLPAGQPAWGDGDRARLLREVADSLAFAREAEALGAIAAVTVAGMGPRTTEIAAALADWLAVPVRPLDLAAALGAGEPPEALTPWGAALGVAIRPC
jgi:type IV pilus assembly protein PilM